MLTPGDWLITGNFWDDSSTHFLPLRGVSLLMAFLLAGLFGFFDCVEYSGRGHANMAMVCVHRGCRFPCRMLWPGRWWYLSVLPAVITPSSP